MEKRRVFLSFDSDDIQQIRGLRFLVANPNYDLEFYDESLKISIDSHQAEYIKTVIRDKIKRASVTLCLVGHNTHKSSWVDWELNESERQDNSIVAMMLKGVDKAIFPKYLRDNSITVYVWDPDYLTTLIKKAKR